MVFLFNNWRNDKFQRDGPGSTFYLCIHRQGREFNHKYVSEIIRQSILYICLDICLDICSHDEMAKLLGVPALSFDIIFPGSGLH